MSAKPWMLIQLKYFHKAKSINLNNSNKERLINFTQK